MNNTLSSHWKSYLLHGAPPLCAEKAEDRFFLALHEESQRASRLGDTVTLEFLYKEYWNWYLKTQGEDARYRLDAYQVDRDVKAARQARENRTIAAYQTYLRKERRGLFRVAFQKILDGRARSARHIVDQILSERDQRKANRYLRLVENGHFPPDLTDQVRAFVKEEKDFSNISSQCPDDWGQLSSTVKQIDHFREVFPKSPHLQELVDRRRQLIASKTPLRKGTVESWQEYLEKYPNGICSNTARRVIRSDKFACREAKQVDTPEAWGSYRERFPTGECGPFSYLRPYSSGKGRVSGFLRVEGGMVAYQQDAGWRESLKSWDALIIVGFSPWEWADLSLGFAPGSMVITVDLEFNLLARSRWNPTLGVRGGFGVSGDSKGLYTVEADLGLEFWMLSFWSIYMKVGGGYAWNPVRYRFTKSEGIIVPVWFGTEFRY